MDSWRDLNPTWGYREWNEKDLFLLECQKQYDTVPELFGKADIWRYEILKRHGGFFIDADSQCLRPLEDYFCDNESFACYENEHVRPGLISNGYLACSVNSPLMTYLIRAIQQIEPTRLVNAEIWRVLGPGLLTDIVKRYNYNDLKVYPSHYFIPVHHTGQAYTGPDKSFCTQAWGSTKNAYGKL
jgi:mannosyltransferase OCH1-like enzyme